MTGFEWVDDAACRGSAGALQAMYSDERHLQIWAVKKWCNTCPVAAACLAHKRTFGERHGVWGGELPDGQPCLPGMDCYTEPAA